MEIKTTNLARLSSKQAGKISTLSLQRLRFRIIAIQQ
jgi:hypothetical protein